MAVILVLTVSVLSGLWCPLRPCITYTRRTRCPSDQTVDLVNNVCTEFSKRTHSTIYVPCSLKHTVQYTHCALSNNMKYSIRTVLHTVQYNNTFSIEHTEDSHGHGLWICHRPLPTVLNSISHQSTDQTMIALYTRLTRIVKNV
jgi:hypothetical protein